jgi:phage tail-like protein
MAANNDSTNPYPFTTFNFSVEINREGESESLCRAAFSECEGLEVTMEAKTIRQGGDNGRQIHLAGPVGYGQLALKRGMTSNIDLWDWFDAAIANPGLRANIDIVMYAGDGQTEQAKFTLTRCLPVRLRAPALNAKEGLVAIEELRVAYERLKRARPGAP